MSDPEDNVPQDNVPDGAPRLARGPARALWLAGGVGALALAALGAALPLLPTTPFLLVAAYAFARSSPRLHAWLLGHRRFGPLIRDWQAHGAIAPKAKRAAVIAMAATPFVSVVLGAPLFVIAIQIPVLAASAAFVVTRPDGAG
ncbi:MAG: YbaN family protein [Parvularculaceae bacterium]